MRAANLLPPDLRTTRRKPPAAAIAAVAAGALVGAAITGGFLAERGKVNERRVELESLQAQLAAVPRPTQPKVRVSPQVTAEKDARLAALNTALAGRLAWDRVLRELSLVLPEDVWLKSLSAKSPQAATGAPNTTPATGTAAAGQPTNGLVINGFTYSQEGVARLLSRLALVPNLDNVKLQSSSVTDVASRRLISFAIAADVRPAGGVTP